MDFETLKREMASLIEEYETDENGYSKHIIGCYLEDNNRRIWEWSGQEFHLWPKNLRIVKENKTRKWDTSQEWNT